MHLYIFSGQKDYQYLLRFIVWFQDSCIALLYLEKSLMADVNISAEYFGIIFTVLGIISSIASANQNIFHKKFKNKTLSRLSNAFIVALSLA